ncbi:hypothetical protein PanWU01x14_016050, partial [Parasponia andersonii]
EKRQRGQIRFWGFVMVYLFQVIVRLLIVALWSPKVKVDIHVSSKKIEGSLIYPLVRMRARTHTQIYIYIYIYMIRPHVNFSLVYAFFILLSGRSYVVLLMVGYFLALLLVFYLEHDWHMVSYPSRAILRLSDLGRAAGQLYPFALLGSSSVVGRSQHYLVP